MSKFDFESLIALFIFGLVVAGWITHIVVCLQDEKYILLVAGAIAAPVGALHGIGHWFGIW